MTTPDDVITFWREAGPDKWFKKSGAFDDAIRDRFGDAYAAARRGELDGWANGPRGALALVILLDQFSRNLEREAAAAFSHDEKALALARHAVAHGWIEDLLADEETRPVAVFALMPYMHSESIVAQQEGVRLMLRPDWKENFDFAVLHRDIIARFGRFPHRNAVLARWTTPAERAFLEAGGFSG